MINHFDIEMAGLPSTTGLEAPIEHQFRGE
jgi:hypothetical protein